ncbi:MAG TPA: hypothetical protein VGG19_03125 [Tepidisphaeraceae bacterium]|jgi:hypothetical protein
MNMMEPLESRRLLSAVVAAATTTSPSPGNAPPAQELYQDPFIQVSYQGKILSRDAVLGFGSFAQNGESITKTISLYYTQGNPQLPNHETDGSVLTIKSNQAKDIASLQSGSVDQGGADLIKQFASEGITLSKNALVVTEATGSEWLVKNGNQYYLIDVVDGNLAVTRYHFVVDPKGTGAKGNAPSISALIASLDTNTNTDTNIKVTTTLRQAFAAYGVSLKKHATIQVENVGSFWYVSSGLLVYSVAYSSTGVLAVSIAGGNTSGVFPPLIPQNVTNNPAGFSASIPVVNSDHVHATFTITFDPADVKPGKSAGNIIFFVNDGSNDVVAVNVSATVLPIAAVKVSRIDIGRLPKPNNPSSSTNVLPKNGLAHVQLSNTGSLMETGSVQVDLYASTTDSANTADATFLGTGEAALEIKSDRNKAVKVHFVYSQVTQAGQYYIFAVATGPSLIAISGATYISPITETISPPEINLSGVATSSPSFLTHSTTQIAVPILNSGNITAHGIVDVSIYTLPPSSEPGASSSPSLLGSYELEYDIKRQRQAIRTIRIGTPVDAGWEILAEITAVHVPADVIDASTLPDTFAVR